MSTESAERLRRQLDGNGWEDAVGIVPWTPDAVLYRLVRNDPPRASDFRPFTRSNRARLDTSRPYVVDAGVSVFDDERAARARGMAPTLLAVVEVPEGAGVVLAKTYGPNHFTIWGEPEHLARHSHVVDRIVA